MYGTHSHIHKIFYRLQLTSPILQCDQSGICCILVTCLCTQYKCWQILQKTHTTLFLYMCVRVFQIGSARFSLALSLSLGLSLELAAKHGYKVLKTNEWNQWCLVLFLLHSMCAGVLRCCHLMHIVHIQRVFLLHSFLCLAWDFSIVMAKCVWMWFVKRLLMNDF